MRLPCGILFSALSQKVIIRGNLCIFGEELRPVISFKCRHFKQDIILMLVRWYLAYSLSYRDVEELALERVTMDKSGANQAGMDTINLHLALLFMLGGLFLQLTVRQIKYLNNIVEQDHRFIKKITKPMKGFKAFQSADATLAGIELHHMLRKKHHTESANQTIFEQFYGLAA